MPEEIKEESYSKDRRRYNEESKTKAVKEWMGGEPIGKVSEKYGIPPQSLRGWKSKLQQGNDVSFDNKKNQLQLDNLRSKITQLETDNQLLRIMHGNVSVELEKTKNPLL